MQQWWRVNLLTKHTHTNTRQQGYGVKISCDIYWNTSCSRPR